MRHDLLGIYLNDHLAGSGAGVGLARRIAARHSRSVQGADLHRLAEDIEEDRRSLLAIMDALGARVRRYKVLGGRVAEKAAGLKPNGALYRRSGLSTVIEIETLRLGVEGKALLWRTLHAVASQDDRLDAARLDDLSARAERQIDLLERLRMSAVAVVFSDGPLPLSASAVQGTS
ncbi:hypothetical protein ACIP6P_29075 [Streptomyces sp. NPDC088729]|uniref:hypothetical protein n=1 Tax=Streptomyces sp. NPDC088729 TaxID=3365876 RepID=UPI0038200C0D